MSAATSDNPLLEDAPLPRFDAIRPEHVELARDAPQERIMDAETLFMEPMGADTLGWFQFGEHRLSARLVPQVARGVSGRVGLAVLSDHISLFDPSSEARL